MMTDLKVQGLIDMDEWYATTSIICEDFSCRKLYPEIP